jgi:putative membrane protein
MNAIGFQARDPEPRNSSVQQEGSHRIFGGPLQHHAFWTMLGSPLNDAWKRDIMNGAEKKPDQSDAARNPAKSGDEASQSYLPATTQTHLAWLRTRMSIETALAAWVRTASSLIGFGFAIVQFFEHFNESRGPVPPTGQHLARYVGLVLIGTGSLATGVAVSEYRKVVKYLEGEAFRGIAGVPGLHRIYPALVVAVLLCLVGLLAFFTILAGAELPWPGRS